MSNPFDGVFTKLNAGQSVIIQAIGDSTVADLYDSYGNYGWVGRFAILLGAHYDVAVYYRPYGGNQITLYTGTGAHSHTVTMLNGGISSQYIQTLTNYINGSNPLLAYGANADAVFIGTGINDTSQGATPDSFVPNYLGFIDLIKSHCTTATITVTTQNPTNNNFSAQYETNYDALILELAGQARPITPPLIASTKYPNVWSLDTQQAYNNVWQSTLMADALHPNATGHAVQAAWMLDALLASPPPPPAPIITTDTLTAMTRNVPFSQTLEATGATPITWSITGGRLPFGLTLKQSTGEISGSPIAFGGTYNVTIRATNISGFDEQGYTGTIDANTFPFIPATEATVSRLVVGNYYPVRAKIRTATGFKTMTMTVGG